MKNIRVLPVFTYVLLLWSVPFLAHSSPELGLWDGFTENISDSFSGTNLIYHAAGIAATPALIRSGTDTRVYEFFRNTPNDAALPGAIAGSGLGALAAGWALYKTGSGSGDQESMGAAFVIAQASLITVSTVILLKSVTGRGHPTNASSLTAQEQSEQFEFFKSLRAGYGWPSGHVSHAVAVTSALAHYYPQKTWLRTLSWGLSAYMLYTVSAFHSGQMHWFSDGIAGALMGYAIGSTVGKNFRRRLYQDNEPSKTEVESYLMPVGLPGYVGISATFQF